MTTESRWVMLCSPVFWAALTVLVINDHVLKGSGALPGWLTGKLSDFAGLVVAPLTLIALSGARRPAARLACLAAVAAAFAAIKLASEPARLVEDLSRRVGLGWRICSDPTDLFAFAVLPLSWRLSLDFAHDAAALCIRSSAWA